ncbi:Filamentous hemagglutinin [Labeo rohita]|uniref:Filamentous hemagglutinin n=1 Tax=Labeo rohita TaxID=84645 RepID=A0ABQ8LY02_LABRO|nr:Filamentous hemagglutinin [Labeo rohita]
MSNRTHSLCIAVVKQGEDVCEGRPRPHSWPGVKSPVVWDIPPSDHVRNNPDSVLWEEYGLITQRLHSEDFDIYMDMPCLLLPSSSICPIMTTQSTPSQKPLTISNTHPHHHHCILLVPQLTLSPSSLVWVCSRSASFHRNHGWMIPCLCLRTPPWPIDAPAPAWLLAPSPQWLASPQALLGSLIPSAPPWSVIIHLPAAPHPSVPLALSGSSFPPAPRWSSVAPAPPQPFGPRPPLWLALWILCITLAHRLFVSAWDFTTTCSAAVSRVPGVVSHSATMTPPSGSTVGHYPGCGLGPTRLHLFPPVFSLAPSSILTTLATPVSVLSLSLSLILHGSVGFHSCFSLCHHHPGCLPALCRPLSPSRIHSFVLSVQSFIVSSAQSRAFQERGDMSHMDCVFVFILPKCSFDLVFCLP